MVESTLPDGIEPGDYEAIEAAVAETVRGRWFLNEYARRCRTAEIGQVLDAVARVESAVTARPMDAGPSDRLLLARAGEVAATLRLLAADFQLHDLPHDLLNRLDSAVRAVAALAPAEPSAPRLAAPERAVDPHALDHWDGLPLPEKLALFT